LRVLHLADRLSTRGGADHHLRDLLTWQATRHTVTLIVGRVEPGLSPPDGVRLGRASALARTDDDPRGLDALAQAITDADVLHLHNVMNPAALRQAVDSGKGIITLQDHRAFCPGPGRTLPDGLACDRAPGPTACAACLPEPSYRERLCGVTEARWRAMEGARFVVLSRYMAAELARLGRPGASVIPPWVTVRPNPPPIGRAFVLGGRLVSHKDPRSAWAAWRDSGVDAPLWLAGDGPLAPQLPGANPLGWLSRSALRETLARSRALLFPTRWQEPFGILGVEALAEGRPVIVTPRGGVGDWAESGVLCVAPGDHAGMVAAIVALHQDAALAARLGAAGRTFVQEHLSESRLSASLEALYAEVAGG
jgi:glycosyltransferase involved in cell wall biosynthesis